ncbi:hypothetical protein HZA96_04080 [Candidatus Woesearchaeota archaeon]|nr:hypothetical protein [Candidatus Woesearchaeota archaeon]
MASGEGAAKLFVYSIVGFFGGLWFFYKGFKKLKLKRTIENMPTSNIRSLAIGLVEVYAVVLPYQELLKSKVTNFGQAVPKEILKSPFSQKECLFYKYTVEKYVRSRRSSYWVTVKEGTAGKYLLVKDKTGSVLVDTEKAELDIPVDTEYNSSFGKDPPANVLNFLKANKVSFEGWFGGNLTMRYREYYIAPGDKLYILGTAGKNPFIKEGTARFNEEGIMIQKGNNATYYISDKDEKAVLSSMKWSVFGGIIGGAVLALACLTYVLFYIGMF